MLKVTVVGLIASVCLIAPTCAQQNLGEYPASKLSATPAGMDIEILQDSELPPSFFSAELHDEDERVKTSPTDESQNSKKQRMTVPRAPETIAIRYVSNAGNDADDGLSWGSAKRTIYAALVSLPGGNIKIAGSGTVYVSNASLANPNMNAGIWLMGPKDPNYASPPPGWLKCSSCTVNIIGIADVAGGPNGHKPRVQLAAGGHSDRNHPAIWLSAVSQPIYIANFQMNYAGRVVVIGECSNNDRTGTCGSQNIVLDNDSGLLSQRASLGPCTDIASNVFWVWMRDYGCGGNAYTATGGMTADNAAAILLDGSAGSGSGLIFVDDSDIGGGGIKVKLGSNGASLYVRNLMSEGDYVHAVPPAVWFTSWSQSVDAVLDSVQCADYGRGSMNCIENDGTSGGGPTVFNSSGVTGPATIINPDQQNTSFQTTSFLRQKQSGIFNNYLVGLTDVARRATGLVPLRFPNKAASSPASWAFPQGTGGVTFIRGLTDPYGGTGAAKVAFNSAKQQLVEMGCVPYAPTHGDWIVAGVWAQNLALTGTSLNTGAYGYPSPTFSYVYSNYGMIVGDGQWQYLWIAEKVASGSSTNVCISADFTNTLTPTLYGPTLYIIPAGTQSDNEVLEFASTMSSVDPDCKTGQICNVTGHPLVVSSLGTLSNCNSLTSPAHCGSAPAGSFVLEVGSTTAIVNTKAVTANSQILVIEDSSLGAKLHVSCDKTVGRTYMISDRSPGNSFTVSSSLAPTSHPACLSFQLLN
jgi:hypothetical protein